jgi:hypothetical protein
MVCSPAQTAAVGTPWLAVLAGRQYQPAAAIYAIGFIMSMHHLLP